MVSAATRIAARRVGARARASTRARTLKILYNVSVMITIRAVVRRPFRFASLALFSRSLSGFVPRSPSSGLSRKLFNSRIRDCFLFPAPVFFWFSRQLFPGFQRVSLVSGIFFFCKKTQNPRLCFLHRPWSWKQGTMGSKVLPPLALSVTFCVTPTKMHGRDCYYTHWCR